MTGETGFSVEAFAPNFILPVQPAAAERTLTVEGQNLRLRTQAGAESDRDLGFRLSTWTFSRKCFGTPPYFPMTAHLCLTLDHSLFFLCFSSMSDERFPIIKLQ